MLKDIYIISYNSSLNIAINLVPSSQRNWLLVIMHTGLAVKSRCLSGIDFSFSSYFLRQLELHVCISPQVSGLV